uniref:MARVEL domain-containing protein n=1 Tax=Bos indicus x Bos taurus TaxID=30522 RepID=A0A4W2GL14_BOBOX
MPGHRNIMPTRASSPDYDDFWAGFWYFRLPELFSTCVAFSLVADMGFARGDIGNWSMSIWCFCFAMTLIIVMVELWRLPSHFPFYWYNFPVTYACYAALVCLSTSITYSITYVQFLLYGPSRDRAIAATAFSCIASVVYALDVAWVWDWYDLSDIPCYVHTVPGLLKVLETFVAGVIFAFLSNTSLYLHQPALEWCVAVYSICFILAAMEYTATHHSRAGWCRYREVLLIKTKMTQATALSRIFSRPGSVC